MAAESSNTTPPQPTGSRTLQHAGQFGPNRKGGWGSRKWAPYPESRVLPSALHAANGRDASLIDSLAIWDAIAHQAARARLGGAERAVLDAILHNTIRYGRVRAPLTASHEFLARYSGVHPRRHGEPLRALADKGFVDYEPGAPMKSPDGHRQTHSAIRVRVPDGWQAFRDGGWAALDHHEDRDDEAHENRDTKHHEDRAPEGHEDRDLEGHEDRRPTGETIETGETNAGKTSSGEPTPPPADAGAPADAVVRAFYTIVETEGWRVSAEKEPDLLIAANNALKDGATTSEVIAGLALWAIDRNGKYAQYSGERIDVVRRCVGLDLGQTLHDAALAGASLHGERQDDDHLDNLFDGGEFADLYRLAAADQR